MKITATGNCRLIRDGFIFISNGQRCLVYPLDLIKEIKCCMYGPHPVDFSLPFNQILLNKRIKIILRGETDVR